MLHCDLARINDHFLDNVTDSVMCCWKLNFSFYFPRALLPSSWSTHSELQEAASVAIITSLFLCIIYLVSFKKTPLPLMVLENRSEPWGQGRGSLGY